MRAVIFDWDGTLMDSFAATRHASMAVFRHFGVAMDEGRYRDTYQPNWHATYREVGIAADCWDEANRVWQRHYRERIATVRPFPGTESVLDALADRALGVVTSADRGRLHADVARLGWGERFGALVGFEDAGRQKPAPDGLLRALEELGVAPAEAVIVGDRPEDVLMGRRAGTATIGIPSAYGSRELLAAAAPDRVLDSIREVPAALSVPSASRC